MPRIPIITPALANANNGNWQTAWRWQRALEATAQVPLQQIWDGAPADALIALHARRSASSITAGASRLPIALVLTGTDLYRDIRSDAQAQQSLELASILVVLQPQGLDELPAHLRAKARVIEQSAPWMAPLPRSATVLDLVLVGHARIEKDPMTALHAFLQLDPGTWSVRQSPWSGARLNHIGRLDDPELASAMRECCRERFGLTPGITLSGPLEHDATRRQIAASHLLVLPSIMEGGANVLIEAVRSQTAVLASDVGGNRGLLGSAYPGLFPPGDSAVLARLIERYACDAGFRTALDTHCRAVAERFDPAREDREVRLLARDLLALRQPGTPQTSP